MFDGKKIDRKIFLFDNTNKRPDKNDPDFTGTLQDENKQIIGQVYVWRTTSKNGVPYLSGKVTPPTPPKATTITPDTNDTTESEGN